MSARSPNAILTPSFRVPLPLKNLCVRQDTEGELTPRYHLILPPCQGRSPDTFISFALYRAPPAFLLPYQFQSAAPEGISERRFRPPLTTRRLSEQNNLLPTGSPSLHGHRSMKPAQRQDAVQRKNKHNRSSAGHRPSAAKHLHQEQPALPDRNRRLPSRNHLVADSVLILAGDLRSFQRVFGAAD